MHWGPTWPFELGPRTIGSCVQVIQGLSVHLKDSASVNVAEGNKFEYIDFCNEAYKSPDTAVSTSSSDQGHIFSGCDNFQARPGRVSLSCLYYLSFPIDYTSSPRAIVKDVEVLPPFFLQNLAKYLHPMSAKR